VLGEAHQHLYRLWFQTSAAGEPGHGVERRLDVIGPADAEAILQGPARREAHYTTARTWLGPRSRNSPGAAQLVSVEVECHTPTAK
jgi:hypothetical protein